MSKQLNIINGTQITRDILEPTRFTKPKAHSAGGKVVNWLNGDDSVYLSTPNMLTWGAQEGQDKEKNPTGKFTMSLQFPSSDYETEDQTQFLNGMKTIIDFVKEKALENSLEWFGKKYPSIEIIDALFNSMLRHPMTVKGGQIPDLNKPPTLSVKIPKWGDVWKPEIYNESGEPLFIQKYNPTESPLPFLPSKTRAKCLIQCGGIWFVNGKFSIIWNLVQCVVQTPKQNLTEGCCLLGVVAPVTNNASAKPTKATNNVTIVESDDEEEEEETKETIVVESEDEGDTVPVPELVPEPAPVPVPAPAPEPEHIEVVQESKPVKKVIKKVAK